MSEKVLSLQDALCLNYNNDNQFVTQEQIGVDAYAEWTTLISELRELALNVYRKKRTAEYSQDEENAPIFNILRKINSHIGVVNGYYLYFNSTTANLIVTFCSGQHNINHIPYEHLFRFRFEHFLGRYIQVQRIKSQKMLNDEFCEHKLKRNVSCYLKQQRKKSQLKQIILKDNSSCNNMKKSGGYSPICDLSSVLYIYKGQIRCKRDQHEMISATARLFGRRDNEIVLNVEYCTKCKKYLLEYSVYEEYRKRYGVIIGNLRMESSGGITGDYDLAAESPLRLTGYGVGQKEGYTSKERQYILAQIIHNHIMTKQEVIKYLSYFIKMNGARLGNEHAVSKWQEDMQFVQNYNINSQPSMIIKEVKRY